MGMGQSVSLQVDEDEEEGSEEEEEEEEEESNSVEEEAARTNTKTAVREGSSQHSSVHENKDLMKLDASDELEQDPEIVPFESSASPVSSVTTPHLGPSVRVWDPGHMLSPLGHSHQGRSFSSRMHIPPGASLGDEICTDVYLIRHAESNMNTLPGLIGGRSPSATVAPEGRRQARALGVFLLSHGLHFDAVISSPIERCKQTAIAVCQEVNFTEEKIEYSDALMELSQGVWEGLRRSEIYTPELVNVINNSQPDFHAPGGESQRQVEHRMIEFLNNVVLPRSVEASLHKDPKLSNIKQGKTNLLMQVHPLNDINNEEKTSELLIPSTTVYNNPHTRGSGKSRLRIASNGTTISAVGDMAASAHLEQKTAHKPVPYNVAVFSHGLAIKCLLRGILGSDPRMTPRLTIDNTSMTVLRHSSYHGWQILRVNDTAHLRLL